MNDTEQPNKYQPPIAIAGCSCFFCLVFMLRVARPAVLLLNVWWAELLVLASLPFIVTFAILYRSDWHRETEKMKRIFILLLYSFVILCSVSFLAVVGLAVLSVYVYDFTAFHV
ncbi:MAG: hypothetical protein WCJ07_04480 [Verrucomicrobiota bacterium]